MIEVVIIIIKDMTMRSYEKAFLGQQSQVIRSNGPIGDNANMRGSPWPNAATDFTWYIAPRHLSTP